MDEKTAGIQPIIRSLAVLEALNDRSPMGLERLRDLTKLPKPTLVRLLDTLIEAGYVRRLSRRDGYALTERVLRLSGGFRYADKVVEAARPFISALTARHKWPVAVATRDRNAMVVRASTRRESPYSVDPDYTNKRVPILVAALGRAYLAFCPQEERELILAMLRASRARRNALAQDEKAVERLLSTIRQQGFASAATLHGDATMGIAIAIMNGPNVAATMTMRYFGSVMSEEEAARRYLAPMQEAARAIASSLAESPQG
jgi:IclR family mhp operon transcriptional activator